MGYLKAYQFEWIPIPSRHIRQFRVETSKYIFHSSYYMFQALH